MKCFILSIIGIILEDFYIIVLILEISTFRKFVYLDSCITTGSYMKDENIYHMRNAVATFTDRPYVWYANKIKQL